MKKVLVISPYFPPSNAADMQRVRMSLPYFKEYNWEAEVVSVSDNFSDTVKDHLLPESVPANIVLHQVKAFSKKWTAKAGLGSIALRSLWFYRIYVDKLLKSKKFDLIYFSTTQFPVCTLGGYWKKKFGIPYVIDMQDPWHSEYYMSKPKHERPPKYWFSYRLNKYLEPLAMKNVDGLISVSQAYIQTLKDRYPGIKDIPARTITFGAFQKDKEIVQSHINKLDIPFTKDAGKKNLVYIGRGGNDMRPALEVLFKSFKRGLKEEKPLFSQFKFHFIGTSYAPKGQGKATISPLAAELDLSDFVSEQTDRIPFYQGLAGLQAADGLIVPGSDDPQYTASKLYPYIMAEKSLLGIFHPSSSAVDIMRDCNVGEMILLKEDPGTAYQKVRAFLELTLKNTKPQTNWQAFEPYTAREMTRKQCDLFEEILTNSGRSKA